MAKIRNLQKLPKMFEYDFNCSCGCSWNHNNPWRMTDQCYSCGEVIEAGPRKEQKIENRS